MNMILEAMSTGKEQRKTYHCGMYKKLILSALTSIPSLYLIEEAIEAPCSCAASAAGSEKMT